MQDAVGNHADPRRVDMLPDRGDEPSTELLQTSRFWIAKARETPKPSDGVSQFFLAHRNLDDVEGIASDDEYQSLVCGYIVREKCGFRPEQPLNLDARNW